MKLFEKAVLAKSAAASLAGAILVVMRGQVLPGTLDSSAVTAVYSSLSVTLMNIALIFCYLLPLAGFLVLYNLIEIAKPSPLAFTGLFFAIAGTAMALILLALPAFVFPFLVNYPMDHKSVFSLLMEKTTMGIGILSALSYTAGTLLFGLAIWKALPVLKFPTLLFMVHGVLLSFGFPLPPVLAAGWVLLAVFLAWPLFVIKKSSAPASGSQTGG